MQVIRYKQEILLSFIFSAAAVDIILDKKIKNL